MKKEFQKHILFSFGLLIVAFGFGSMGMAIWNFSKHLLMESSLECLAGISFVRAGVWLLRPLISE